MKWFRGKSASSAGGGASESGAAAARVVAEARAEIEAGRPVKALKLTEQAAAAGEKSPELFFVQGISLEQVGRHEEAFRAYARELEINPQHAGARKAHDALAKALARPQAKKIPTGERPWATSLARPNLNAVQQSLHNYTYRGVPMLKNPFDMALYSLLLWNVKPKTIFEIGSKSGGSGLWFGDQLQTFQIPGRVISIDIVRVETVAHPLVTFMEGNGRELEATLTADFLRELPRPWLVIEDADHSYETSIAVLNFFDSKLQRGEYIVIEDGIISDLPGGVDGGSGPHRALKEFFGKRGGAYEVDADYCDFFGYNMTWCTNGFLKKIAD